MFTILANHKIDVSYGENEVHDYAERLKLKSGAQFQCQTKDLTFVIVSLKNVLSNLPKS